MNAERFLADVKGHDLTVIKDEGVYRHLRFRNPATSNMFFDLVTWPGFLAYSGDMGCYVFARLTDIFEFFRGPVGKFRIDFNYWAQKIEAADKNDGFKKFSEEKFTRKVMEYLVGWIRENREETTKEQRRALWDEVVREVIDASCDDGGYRKQCAAHDFIHHIYSAIWGKGPRWSMQNPKNTDYCMHNAKDAYARSWELKHGEGSWKEPTFAWVTDFKLVVQS